MITAPVESTKPAAGVITTTAGDRTGAHAENRGVSAEDFLDRTPDEGGDGRGERGRHESVGGDTVGGDGATGVETIPAHPEHAGADHTEHHAVRGHLDLTEAETRPENDTEQQSGPTGGHMHHSAASEVDRLDGRVRVPDAVHVASRAPDHVGQREVDDQHPDRDESQ